MDDRVHVDDGGVERPRWVWHVGLGQTKRAHGGREGCERSVGGVMEGVGGGAKRVPYKFVKFKLCCSGEASSTTKTVYFPPVC